MLKKILLALMLVSAFSIAGCEQEGPAERAGENIDEAAEEVEEAAEDACEEVKEGVDAEDDDC